MKYKIILSINILGFLLYANTVFADNFISNWYNTNITGMIEVPIQQGCSQTCWLLSAVSGLNETEIGKAIIADTIKSDGNGGAVVTFKGALNNPIPVSALELAKFDSLNSTNKCTFSTGDADMRALEIATQKLYQNGNFDSRLSDDVIAGREDSDLLLTFELLTGSDQTSWKFPSGWLGAFFLPDNITRLRKSDIDNFKNTDQYSTVSFTSDDTYATDRKNGLPLKLIGDNKHQYTILSSDDKSVYLLDSIYGDKFEMNRDDFLEALPTVFTQKLDLNMIPPEYQLTDGDYQAYLDEIGAINDYEMTDADYQEIVDGYDYYKDPNAENNCDSNTSSSSPVLEGPNCKGWSAIPNYSNKAIFPKGIMSGDYLLINWEDAQLYCKSLGDGFRLPTVDEIWAARDLSWTDKDGGYNACFDNLSQDRNSNYWTVEGSDIESWNNEGRLVRCIQ